MKTRNRVRTNGSTPTIASQPQTPQPVSAEFKLPSGDFHPTCLCLYDREAQGPVKKIPLTEDELYRLFKLTYEPVRFHGMSAEDFIAEAIREKLESATAQPKLQNSFTDADVIGFFKQLDVLDNNIDKMRYLNESMLNSLEHWGREGCPTESAMNELANGFHLLREELETAFKEHHDATRALFAKFSPALTGLLAAELEPTLAVKGGVR